MRKLIISAALIFLALSIAHAQNVQVNSANRTISVTADEKVSAPAEVARIEVGYDAYAMTSEDAFKQLVVRGNRISDALLRNGLKAQDIESGNVDLSTVSPDENWTPEMKKERLFEAKQKWKFQVKASTAQQFLSVAAQAGANEIDKPEWDVADPAALQAKAGAAALIKARKIAEQMAEGLGARLSALVFASNRAPVTFPFGLMTENADVRSSYEGPPPPPPASLKLFPEKVDSTATVYAVFSIQ